MIEREEIGGATLYLGDCLEVLRDLGEIDMVFSDPPYSSGGQFRGDRMQDVKTKYAQRDATSVSSMHQLPAFSGDNRDQAGYWFWVSLWVSVCREKLPAGGICALFTDWRQLPITSMALQSGGLVWRGIVPWHKPSARPTQGRWANACEYVVWGTNGPRALEGSALPGFYSGDAPREREHMTQKPIGVVQSMLRILPRGGVVLDPFMGSGTTGVACAIRGLRFVGVEQDPEHFKTARKRIGEAYQHWGSELSSDSSSGGLL